MRAPHLMAFAALALAACGDQQEAENSVNVDATATAEDIVSNDTTAIDAATGADANMAADVEYNLDEFNDLSADENEANAASANNAL